LNDVVIPSYKINIKLPNTSSSLTFNSIKINDLELLTSNRSEVYLPLGPRTIVMTTTNGYTIRTDGINAYNDNLLVNVFDSSRVIRYYGFGKIENSTLKEIQLILGKPYGIRLLSNSTPFIMSSVKVNDVEILTSNTSDVYLPLGLRTIVMTTTNGYTIRTNGINAYNDNLLVNVFNSSGDMELTGNSIIENSTLKQIVLDKIYGIRLLNNSTPFIMSSVKVNDVEILTSNTSEVYLPSKSFNGAIIETTNGLRFKLILLNSILTVENWSNQISLVSTSLNDIDIRFYNIKIKLSNEQSFLTFKSIIIDEFETLTSNRSDVYLPINNKNILMTTTNDITFNASLRNNVLLIEEQPLAGLVWVGTKTIDITGSNEITLTRSFIAT